MILVTDSGTPARLGRPAVVEARLAPAVKDSVDEVVSNSLFSGYHLVALFALPQRVARAIYVFHYCGHLLSAADFLDQLSPSIKIRATISVTLYILTQGLCPGSPQNQSCIIVLIIPT
jgi:hypothetical protein